MLYNPSDCFDWQSRLVGAVSLSIRGNSHNSSRLEPKVQTMIAMLSMTVETLDICCFDMLRLFQRVLLRFSRGLVKKNVSLAFHAAQGEREAASASGLCLSQKKK